jgi:hypothetical protein
MTCFFAWSVMCPKYPIARCPHLELTSNSFPFEAKSLQQLILIWWQFWSQLCQMKYYCSANFQHYLRVAFTHLQETQLTLILTIPTTTPSALSHSCGVPFAILPASTMFSHLWNSLLTLHCEGTAVSQCRRQCVTQVPLSLVHHHSHL